MQDGGRKKLIKSCRDYTDREMIKKNRIYQLGDYYNIWKI